MIGIKLEGRLGNQLFQYAFAYSTAKKINTKFYFDSSIEKLVIPQYFKIKTVPFYYIDKTCFSVNGFKNLLSVHLRRIFYKTIKTYYSLHEVVLSSEAVPKNELLKICNGSLFIGYFQSEDYFKDSSKEVKEQFSIHESYKNQFNEIFSLLPQNKNYVVIHVRRGDYVDLNLAKEANYYHKAIQTIHSDNNFYIIISDDHSFINKEFDYLENKYISNHNEIIDFQFLVNAQTCILSNSSFSWWGAYLNTNINNKVLAPANWCGENLEYPLGISNNLKWTWI